MNGAKYRDILQRHLRWTVRADRNAAMRSTQVDVAPADGCHANLVIGAGQEARKGIKERHLPRAASPTPALTIICSAM
jgi:hypothetical protein